MAEQISPLRMTVGFRLVEMIGIHMPEMLAKFRNEVIVEEIITPLSR